MSEVQESLMPKHTGFQKWIKLSIDDFPLIRPPRQHMLANITGGLEHLYEIISKDKTNKDKKENGKGCDKETLSKNGVEVKDKIEISNTKKRDDEGGGTNSINEDEDEETTPYTNPEGEFVPEDSMPLLASRYKFVEVVANGQSASIIKALDTFSKDKPVAIKVLHRVYKPIGSQEADILLELHRADPWLHVPFARLQNQFIYGPHYCLVFDFLCPTEQKSIKDQPTLSNVRNLCVKLLTVLGFLHKQNVIHADLKPENILIVHEGNECLVMVIDFGNALRNTEDELSVYYSDYELQTLLYRAPEVIFGLKLGLEIDMWSLGCLLAECYTGEPLFMGHSKEDILVKMTEILGLLPEEFSHGDYSESFAEFVGDPLTTFQRVENLRRKLNNCQDINFLLLIENLLTYSPDKRPNPFEAICHPFIASINPFLYLFPFKDQTKYPRVLLNTSTYPYTPDKLDKNSLAPKSFEMLKRLESFSTNCQATNGPAKEDDIVINEDKSADNPDPEPKKKEIVNDEPQQPTSPESNNVSSLPNDRDSPEEELNVPDSISSPVNDDEETNKHDIEDISDSVEKESDTSPVKDTSPRPPKRKQQESSNVTRKDVKQTLKSMGLRCEDFTISVYSKEQAHAILRKQGVEVTNHVPRRPQPRPPQPNFHMRQNSQPIRPRYQPRQNPNLNPYIRSMTAGIVRPMPNRPRAFAAPPVQLQPPKKPVVEDDDDDDDCVILDPPEGAPKMPPKPRPQPRRFPQQFQLMGTTVQVNRGTKRPMRSLYPAPFSKRAMRHHSRFYGDGYHGEDNSEASVQDTLKRLKNYNISITCRRNANQRHQRQYDSRESDSDAEYGRPDSEDEEEDMARFLECEIDEEERMALDGNECLDLDSSGSIGDYCNDKTPKKRDHNIPFEKLDSTVELEPDEQEENMETNEEEENLSDKETTLPNSEEDEKEKGETKEKEQTADKHETDEHSEKESEEKETEETSLEDKVDPLEDLPESPNKLDGDTATNNEKPDVEEETEQKLNKEKTANVKDILSKDSKPTTLPTDEPKTTDSKKPAEDRLSNDTETKEADSNQEVCDNLDDDINEELEKQLLEAGNLDDDDYEGEDIDLANDL